MGVEGAFYFGVIWVGVVFDLPLGVDVLFHVLEEV